MKLRTLLLSGATLASLPFGVCAQQVSCPDAARTFFEFQVTRPARWVSDSLALHPVPKSTAPQSVVQFIVDTAGVPDMTTFKFLLRRDSLSVEETRRFAATWRFTPSVLNGCRVRQLVQTPVGK